MPSESARHTGDILYNLLKDRKAWTRKSHSHMFLDVHWRWAPRFERAEPSTYWGPALGERKTFGAQSWKEPLVTRGSEGCSSRLHQGRNFTAPSWRWPLIHVSDCVWLLHFIVCFFFFPPRTSVWKLLLPFLIWPWSHLKNTLCLCMLPSVSEASPRKCASASRQVLHPEKHSLTRETLKMLSFLPASG